MTNMNEDRLSTTMRIEIPPELREELQQGRASVAATRKRITRCPPVKRAKSDSRPIVANRYETINDPNFQQLFQSVYDAAIITTPRGDILDANTRAVDFFTCKREDFGEHSILEFISGADEALIDTLRKNLENNRFTLIQAHCQRLDGTIFPAEISVNRLQLTGKDYLSFFVRDITLRRQAEAMVRTVHTAISNAANGIAVTNRAGDLGYVNPATARLWGYATEADLAEQQIQALWVNGTTFDEIMQHVMTTGTAWDGELTARRRDGSEIPLQVSAAANLDADDQVSGMVFSFLDVSDRKRAEEMAREAERQRVMLESVGTACHHLGQPATVLLASLGMMQKRESSIDDDMRSLLRQGLSSAEKLQTILHRLNTINEYRTVQYLDNQTELTNTHGEHILEL